MPESRCEAEMLSAESLDFSYGSLSILKNIHLKASAGSISALIGPNGSGKSTLLRCLCGLLKPSGGSVRVDGRPLESYAGRELARVVSFLPQFYEKVPAVRVSELVAMGRAPYHRSGWILGTEDHQKINWAMDYMNVEYLKDRMVERLSGGEKQRVWLAMLLAQDTPVILLDEPVTYMDLKYQWDLLGILKRLRDDFGKTIITVFHDINHALDLADSIYLLKNGVIYKYGNSEEVITEQSVKDVFDINIHVVRVKDFQRSVVVPQGLRGYKNAEV